MTNKSVSILELDVNALGEKLTCAPADILLFDYIWSDLDAVLKLDVWNNFRRDLWCLDPRKISLIKLTSNDWCKEVVTVTHNALEGVSDGTFRIGCCRRKYKYCLLLEEGDKRLTGTLLEAIDEKIGVGKRKRKKDEIRPGEKNNHMGLLK